MDNYWIFCPSTTLFAPGAQQSIHSFYFFPSFHSFISVTAASNYKGFILTLQLSQTWASWDFLLASSTKAFCHLRPDHFLCMCICMQMCMCSILFQRIPDSITEPIKDHLFQCANLIRPCSDFWRYFFQSHVLSGASPLSLRGKNRAELLTEHPLTHGVTISRPAPNPADTDIDALLIAL